MGSSHRKTSSFDRMIEGLEDGDHVGLWYGSEEDRIREVLPALKRALGQGVRCLWMSGDDGWDAVESALRGDGIDVEAVRSAGTLRVRTDREPFVTDGPDAERLIRAMDDELVGSGEENGTVWIFNDMEWALGRGASHAEFRRRLETWVRRNLDKHRAVVICQYRRGAFTDETMETFLREHPLVLMEDTVFPNPYHVPLEERLAAQGLGRVDWMLESLEARAREVVRIRRNELALATLVDNIPDVVARLDPDRRFLFVNHAAARLAGVPAEDLIGKSLEELGLDPEPHRLWLEAVDRAGSGAGSQELEAVFDPGGGDPRWFHTRAIPEKGRRDDVASVLVIGRDVTEHRRAEEALEGTVRLLRQVFASIEEAVLVIRAPGREVVTCNDAAARMLGYSREELFGRLTRDFHVDQESWERFGRESEKALRAGDTFHGSFQLRRRDGSVFPTEHTVTLLDPEKGLEGGAVSVVRDVSEARRIDELLNSLMVAVIRCRLDGTIFEANDAAVEMFRVAAEERLVGSSAQELLTDGGSWDRIVETIRGSASGRAAVQVRIRRKDDTLGWVSGMGRFLPVAEGQDVVEGVVQDVTEEMRLRQEVVEISAEERLRIGQDLHDDLGQHLTGLALLARDMARRLARDDRPESVDAAEIERLANQAVGKTRHLARGVHPPLLEQHGLAGALGQLAGEAEELFGLKTGVKVDGDPDTVSIAEAEHLYRIAQEATTNAARHGDATEVRITWSAVPGARILEVEDDGAGFRQDEVEHGLGLRIMRYRARLLDGELDILSAPGEGTTIRCALPPVGADGASPETIREAR